MYMTTGVGLVLYTQYQLPICEAMIYNKKSKKTIRSFPENIFNVVLRNNTMITNTKVLQLYYDKVSIEHKSVH